MSKRVLVTVTRGLTDKTPATVYEHEVPILETIHGEGMVELVELGNLVELKGKKVTVIKGTFQTIASREEAKKHDDAETEDISLLDLMRHNLGIGESFNGDPREEFDRMQMKYGMHTEVKLSNVEYVYGAFRDGRFTTALGKADPAKMTMRELRAALDEAGVKFDAKEGKTSLIAKLVQARAEEEGVVQ